MTALGTFYEAINLGTAIFCFSLLSGCVLNTYQLDKQEALRAASDVQTKSETIVRARIPVDNREASIRLFSDDEVEIQISESELFEVELRNLMNAAEKIQQVQVLRFKERSWAPIFFYTGIAATVVSYLASTVIALHEKNGSYAIPVYGPARWSVDVTNDCDGLGCIFIAPAALVLWIQHGCCSPGWASSYCYKRPQAQSSREVPLEQNGRVHTSGLSRWDDGALGITIQGQF